VGKKLVSSVVFACVLLGPSSIVDATVKESARCTQAGKVLKVSDVKLVCGRVNRKLKWILISNPVVTTPVTAAVTTTTTAVTTTTVAAVTTTTSTTTTTTTVSTAIPKILSVVFRAPGADGIYHVGQHIRVAFTFSMPVNVTGAPYVMLEATNIGKTPFLDGNGTTSLLFSYTVVTGDVETSGVGLGANSIVLNGATIKSLSGVTADLTHARLSRSASRLVGP
jgi:hypothetical protein